MKDRRIEITDSLLLVAIPTIFAAIVCGIVNVPETLQTESLLDKLSVFMGIWATLLGFLVTACTILIGLGDNDSIKFMKLSGDYRSVFKCIIISCFLLLIAIGAGGTFLLIDVKIIVLYFYLVGASVIIIISVAISLIYLLFAILNATKQKT